MWVGYGKLLRKFRLAAGYSQEALAPLLGYSAEQLASVEAGPPPREGAAHPGGRAGAGRGRRPLDPPGGCGLRQTAVLLP
ncbi:multiprotein-bridging factor 1 family protein [Streptomyces sp. NPDC007025]|uniref:helix-turn-helix domain-containing protein n=1 Tax=Streptomyces sp. NPDC007025 TaxID=3364771 RepID=UPI0036A05E23